MVVVNLEEMQARSGFVRETAATGFVFVVEGLAGIARVASQKFRGRQVELMWSKREEAVRWSDALAVEPRVTQTSLLELLSRHLPKLADERRLVGPDWTDAPCEPEMSAEELDRLLRRRLIDQLIETATKTRQVWILKSADMPATIVTRHPAGGEALPVFADRASAEQLIDGEWSHCAAHRVPIGDFVQKTIVWCVETRRRIAPAFVPGPGLVEMPAWDMKALLAGGGHVRRVA